MNCPFSFVKSSFLLVSIFLLCSCAKVAVQPPNQLTGKAEFGKASYYAMKYQSRKTASGERLNQYSFTASHRTLPFGTRVKVTNVKNNKSIKVTINDRGPFVKGRVIDLTRSAFSSIGNLKSGLINVKVEVIR